MPTTMPDETHHPLARSGPAPAGLIENIVRFSGLLRANGVMVSFSAVLEACKALPLIDISDSDAFRCLLRVNFVCRKEELATFDALFYSFWLQKNRHTVTVPAFGNGQGAAEPKPIAGSGGERLDSASAPPEADQEMRRQWSLRYSPDSLTKTVALPEISVAESSALNQLIANILQPLANRMSRRFRYSLHGKEIHLRKILRKNMQFGGELIRLDFKTKKLKKRRVILFCDVSGSMDIYTLMILQFIYALKRIDHRTAIFFFSTDLSRGDHLFDRRDFAAALAGLPDVVADWGGGTRIGHCLRSFNETHGRRLLSSKSIVMIFSDGWDRGEVDVLERQMAFLKRKVYKMIWLNPLAGTKDYQPICQGMRAAFPYLDYFLPLGNLHDLRVLGRTLGKVIS
jgi:uncharacterized protein